MADPQIIVNPEISDQGRVLDEEANEWDAGWQNFFKRQKHVVFIAAQVFNNLVTSVTSATFKSAPYKEFSLLIDLVVANTPTDIVIRVDESPDGIKWHQIMNGPFGDIRYEDSAGAKTESIQGKVNCPYIRLRAVATGTTATATFTLTASLLMVS